MPNLNIYIRKLTEIVVIRGLEEVKPANVAKIGRHFFGVIFAEHLYRGGALGVANLLVSLLKGVSLKALPRQRACITRKYKNSSIIAVGMASEKSAK